MTHFHAAERTYQAAAKTMERLCSPSGERRCAPCYVLLRCVFGRRQRLLEFPAPMEYIEDERSSQMRTVAAAKAKITRLLADSEESHEPIQIVGKKNAAVLISVDDWRAIQETLYLLSIPKMRESIIRGIKTPISKTSTELSW